MNNLKKYYINKIIPEFIKKFKYTNLNKVPKIIKIKINTNLGLNAQNKNILNNSITELGLIAGQYPNITRAKKSIATFKIKEKMILGLTVTLRNKKMFAFLEKLIHLVLPKIREFKGLKLKSFDKMGNYNLGITEQLLFPEITYDQVDKLRGFNITIVTTSKNTAEGIFLLNKMGIIFKNN